MYNPIACREFDDNYRTCSDSTGSVSNLGNENIDLTVSVDVANNSVTLTMEGPSNKWFGVGFGSSNMSGAYTLHASGATFQMNERSHGGNGSGTALSSSGAVTSDVTSGGRRTVVFTRSRVGLTSNYYTFSQYSRINSCYLGKRK